MTIEWSKKLCVEYSQQMKSKLEEIMQASGNGKILTKKPAINKIQEAISRRQIGK